MPVTTVIDVSDTPPDLAELSDKIAAEILRHASTARAVRAQRTRTPRQRFPVLAKVVQIAWGKDEEHDALAREAASEILDAIIDDADGQPWRGEVQICGERESTILARVAVKLEDDVPKPRMTQQTELVGVLGALRNTIEGLGRECVRIASARATELEAYAKMVESVADNARKVDIDRGKWDYKRAKREQETELEKVRERETTLRTQARWQGVTDIADEYSDVIEIWSKWIIDAKRSGQGLHVKAPTQAELDGVFAGEAYDAIRALASQMIAEPDRGRRMALAGELRKVMSETTAAQRGELQLRALQILGPERAKECFVWLKMPVTDP